MTSTDFDRRRAERSARIERARGPFEAVRQFLGDLEGEVVRRWGVFTDGNGGHDWWCDYSSKEEVPGSIPIMVLDVS